MTAIVDNKLFFSDERKYRLRRHLLFWLCYWIYFTLLHAVNSWGKTEIMYLQNLPFTSTESVLMLIPQVVMTYPMLYFILPRCLLRKKYATGLLLTAILFFIGTSLNLYMVLNVNQKVLSFVLPEQFMRHVQRPYEVSFLMGLMATMKGGLLCVVTAVGIKLMKEGYMKEHRNLQLQKENTEAQLQLLTAQVQPHFLFNTLNNIYSQTQTESPKGSKMIMGLSDLLNYIIYEGQKNFVVLKQELLMITEYINLERIRYGNKLDVHVSIPDKADEVYIAPLLLLPFIENCFKHGTSNMLENPWINLTIELNNNILIMKLMNGKASQKDQVQNGTGIGISNVRQRLDLLYKDKYELEIREEEDVFVVDLKIELIMIKTAEQNFSSKPAKTDIAYA